MAATPGFLSFFLQLNQASRLPFINHRRWQHPSFEASPLFRNVDIACGPRCCLTEVGILISSALYGMTTLQAWLYAEQYSADKWYLRIMVSIFPMFYDILMNMLLYRLAQSGLHRTHFSWKTRSAPLYPGSLILSGQFLWD